MVLSESYLGDLVGKVKHAGHTVLTVIHLLLLCPEILADAVDLALGTFHKCHPLIRSDACSVRVQRRHHDRGRLVIINALIRAFLLHESCLEILCRRPLHRQFFLPALQQCLKHE